MNNVMDFHVLTLFVQSVQFLVPRIPFIALTKGFGAVSTEFIQFYTHIILLLKLWENPAITFRGFFRSSKNAVANRRY